MKTPTKSPSRQCWVWVTQPEYYLERDGRDALDLNPAVKMDRSEMYWSCDRHTKRGDLVFLYRTAPKKDLAYILQARTDAIADDESVAGGWAYICGYTPVIKLSSPIPLAAFREDEVLQHWCAVRMRFQRRVFPIVPAEWQRLLCLAADLNPEKKSSLQNL